MGLEVLRLGIAARMFSEVSWGVAASCDEGRVATDDDVARSASEHRSTRRAPFFLGTAFGKPLETKFIWVR